MKITWDGFGRLVQMMISNFLDYQKQQAEALSIIANELMEINQTLKLQSSNQTVKKVKDI